MSIRGTLVALALLASLCPTSAYATDASASDGRIAVSASLEVADVPSGIRTIRVEGTECNITVPDNTPGVRDVRVREARSSDAQLFELMRVAWNEYRIRTKASGGYLVEADSEPGSTIRQYGTGTYREDDALWTPVRTESGIGFRNKESGLMMTASEDDSLVVEEYEQDARQSFVLDDASLGIEDGWYLIQGPMGKVLGIGDGVVSDGQRVSFCRKDAKSWSDKGHRFFVQDRGNETFEIASFDPNYVFDITVASPQTKGNLHISARSESRTQRFAFHIGNNGYYEIENVDSGKYLDINDCSSRNGLSIQQCTANHSEAQQFRLVPASKPSTKGEDIAYAAVELACAVDEHLFVDDPSERIYDAATESYVDAREELMDPVGTAWEDPPGEYASCDVATAAAVRYSRADSEFEYRTLINQWPYLRNHFENVGTYVRGGDASLLEPGDILVSDSHISIWVGNETVRERFPKSDADLYEAGYSPAYYPSLVHAGGPDDIHAGDEFTVFRIRE